MLSLFQQRSDFFLEIYFMNVVKVSTRVFFEPHSQDKFIVQLLPWGAAQPVPIWDRYREDVVPRGEQGHVPVRLIRESSKMLVAPIPFDYERTLLVLLLPQRVDVALAPHGLLAAEVLLELRYHVEKHIVLGSLFTLACLQFKAQMSLQVELENTA